MKWEETKISKLLITDVQALDPVTVYIENYGKGRGKMTIEVFGQSWSSFWPAMGNDSIEQFVLSSDNHYLSKNFATLCELSEPDYEAFIKNCKAQIIEDRRYHYHSQEEARKLYDLCNEMDPSKSYFENELNHNDIHRVAGDDWWYSIPDKDSHTYVYLCRILDAVKSCLREREQPLAA